MAAYVCTRLTMEMNSYFKQHQMRIVVTRENAKYTQSKSKALRTRLKTK